MRQDADNMSEDKSNIPNYLNSSSNETHFPDYFYSSYNKEVGKRASEAITNGIHNVFNKLFSGRGVL